MRLAHDMIGSRVSAAAIAIAASMPPFPVFPQGTSRGGVGSPHAAKPAAPPTGGISRRSAEIPLVHPPHRSVSLCSITIASGCKGAAALLRSTGPEAPSL